MSRDRSTSGTMEKPACKANTWGAKVKGMSPRRSGRVDAASTAGGPSASPGGCKGVGGFSATG